MLEAPLVEAATWRTSSYSNGNGGGNCVEVATFDDAVAVRDSRDRGGPVLVMETGAWRSFLDAAKRGTLGGTASRQSQDTARRPASEEAGGFAFGGPGRDEPPR